jgi:GrpB-like predicted nucleotidyltransferase (UPF0157 family)
MSLGLAKGKVQVVEHDANWLKAFEAERESLLKVLARVSAKPVIEHVGGTSVPHLAAKPIVDIAIGFQSAADVSQGLKLMLEAGREYVKGANQPGMLFMAKGDPRQFHYHLVVLGTPAWRKLIAFRNYLRRHRGVVEEYGAMKMALAERFPESRLDYMRYKRPLLRAILQRSFAESRRRRFAVATRLALALEETKLSSIEDESVDTVPAADVDDERRDE